MLAAVHHASDAVTRIGLADRKAIRVAALDRRLHITTRSRPDDCDIPYPYAPAPPARIIALLSAYTAANKASKQATAVLDELSVALDAPSRIIAAAHAATPGRRQTAGQESVPSLQHTSPAPEPGPLPPGRAEGTARALKISDPALLARAMTADEETTSLIAEATAKSDRRNAASNANRTQRPTTGSLQHRAARLAAQDLPHRDFLVQVSKESQGRFTPSAICSPAPAPRPQSHHRRGSAD